MSRRLIALGALLVACLAIPAQAQVPVAIQGERNVKPLDCSGAIATGGTAQNAFTATPNLHGFIISNIDTSEPLWISFTGAAAAGASGSFPLSTATVTTFASAGSFSSPLGFGMNTALSIVAATTSHKYSCVKW